MRIGISSQVVLLSRANRTSLSRISSFIITSRANQADLDRGRKIIESLQVAELDNFFREACLDAEPQSIEAIDPEAVVLYSIILPERLAVIFSQPGKPLQYHQSAIAITHAF